MIEKVISLKNMRLAYRQVVQNKGSAGVDGMTVKELPAYLKEKRHAFAAALCNGKYLPQSNCSSNAVLGTTIIASKQFKAVIVLPVPVCIDSIIYL